MSLEYLIKINADGKGLNSVAGRSVEALSAVERAAARVGHVLAGYLSIHFVERLVAQSLEMASEIDHLAKRAQVGVEKIQEYAAGMRKVGGNIEELIPAMKRLRVAIADAVTNPTGEAALAFSRMGFSIAELQAKNPEQLFDLMAARIKKLPDSAQLTADALQLMGKSADALIPAFRAGFVEAAKAAREEGLIMEKEAIERLDQIEKRISRLKSAMKVGTGRLVSKGVPATNQFMDFIGEYARAYGEQAGPGFTAQSVLTYMTWPLLSPLFSYQAYLVASHNREIGDRTALLEEHQKAALEKMQRMADHTAALHQTMKERM